MAVLLSPIFNLPAFTDTNGDPLAGGKIFQYEAGSFSVLKTTYTTQVGDVANANPIVLNSAGQLPAGVNIWLTEAELYNLVLTEADGTTVLSAFDDVSGVMTDTGGGGPAVSTSVWVTTVGASYQSPTTFLVPGNNVTQYAPGNRVRITLAAGFLYGVVSASTFSTPNTVVTIIPDSGTLNSSLSKAEYSILMAVGPTVDAGAVSYVPSLPYSTAGTVGNKIKSIETEFAADLVDLETSIEAQFPAVRRLFNANAVATNYYAATIPNIILDEAVVASGTTVVMIGFTSSNSGGNATYLNINGTGNRRVYQFSPNGSRVDPYIYLGQMSQVVLSANSYIILDQVPATPFATYDIPHGIWATGTVGNNTFTVPNGVYSITVTIVGGGGGGSLKTNEGTVRGKNGGGAAKVYMVLPVAPGQMYSTYVGNGGNAGSGFFPSGTAGQTSYFGPYYAAGGGAAGAPGTFAGSNAGIYGVVTPGGTGIEGRIGGASGFGPPGAGAYGAGGLGEDIIGSNTTQGGVAGLIMVEW